MGKLKNEYLYKSFDAKNNTLEASKKEYYSTGNLKSAGNLSYNELDIELKENEWKYYDENGKLKERANYIKNHRFGLSVVYEANGNIKEETNYDEYGEINGIHRSYADGKLTDEGNVKTLANGKALAQGKWKHFENGILTYIATYEDGAEVNQVQYHKNGNPSSIFNTKTNNGELVIDGICRTYKEDGTPDSVSIYDNGKIISEKSIYEWKGDSIVKSSTNKQLENYYKFNFSGERRTKYTTFYSKALLYLEDIFQVIRKCNNDLCLKENQKKISDFYDKLNELKDKSTGYNYSSDSEYIDQYAKKVEKATTPDQVRKALGL